MTKRGENNPFNHEWLIDGSYLQDGLLVTRLADEQKDEGSIMDDARRWLVINSTGIKVPSGLSYRPSFYPVTSLGIQASYPLLYFISKLFYSS